MKYRALSAFLLVVLLLTACSDRERAAGNLEELYALALDSILETDEELNSGLDFIAVDMSRLDGVKDEGKQEILNNLETKYGVKAMDATMETLKENGLYGENTLSDGILLKIDTITIKSTNKVIVEGSKYKSSKGAVGVKSTLHYKNKRWNIKRTDIVWQS